MKNGNRNWEGDHKKILEQYNETIISEDINCSRNDTLGQLEILLNEFRASNTQTPSKVLINHINNELTS